MLLKRLIAIAVGLGILILVASAVLWLQTRTPQPRSFTLSTGAEIILHQATFGTNHVIALGGTWRKFLPKFIAQRFNLPWAPKSFATPTPAIVLWFEQRPPPTGGPDYACSIVHADGTETPFNHNSFYASLTPTNSVQGTPSPYPQRDKQVRVRFYEQKNYNDVTPLGEFTLRNPNISRAPRRTAPPLPQTATDGDLEVTLVTLRAGDEERWRKKNFLNRSTYADFEVRQGGNPSTNWAVQKMEATDSTGNTLVSQSWSNPNTKRLEQFSCQPALWPSESYLLRFEFSRKPQAPFTDEELWTVRGIAVPTNGGFVLVDAKTNRLGFNIQMAGVQTEGSSPPWGRSSAGMHFSISPQLTGHRFSLVRVVDQDGKPVVSNGSSYSATDWDFHLSLTNTIKTLDVTVALHRSRYVDFLAQPARATNAPVRRSN